MDYVGIQFDVLMVEESCPEEWIILLSKNTLIIPISRLSKTCSDPGGRRQQRSIAKQETLELFVDFDILRNGNCS